MNNVSDVVAATEPFTCASCGNAMPPEARFCATCGAAVPVASSVSEFPEPPAASVDRLVCPRCGNGMPVEMRFCTECGTALSDSPIRENSPDKKRGDRPIIQIQVSAPSPDMKGIDYSSLNIQNASSPASPSAAPTQANNPSQQTARPSEGTGQTPPSSVDATTALPESSVGAGVATTMAGVAGKATATGIAPKLIAGVAALAVAGAGVATGGFGILGNGQDRQSVQSAGNEVGTQVEKPATDLDAQTDNVVSDLQDSVFTAPNIIDLGAMVTQAGAASKNVENLTSAFVGVSDGQSYYIYTDTADFIDTENGTFSEEAYYSTDRGFYLLAGDYGVASTDGMSQSYVFTTYSPDELADGAIPSYVAFDGIVTQEPISTFDQVESLLGQYVIYEQCVIRANGDFSFIEGYVHSDGSPGFTAPFQIGPTREAVGDSTVYGISLEMYSDNGSEYGQAEYEAFKNYYSGSLEEFGLGLVAEKLYRRPASPTDSAAEILITGDMQADSSSYSAIGQDDVQDGMGVASLAWQDASYLDEYDDGYKLLKSMHISPWIDADNTTLVEEAWALVAGDTTFPTIPQISGKEVSYDQVYHAIGYFMIENKTEGFDITETKSKSGPICLSINQALRGSKLTVAYSSGTRTYPYEEWGKHFFAGDEHNWPYAKVIDNQWGPVPFVITMYVNHTPNEPAGTPDPESVVFSFGSLNEENVPMTIAS